jgi:hypothetical protein
MLKRLGDGSTYVDPNMIAMIVNKPEGGIRIYMKAEGGGAVINFSEGTAEDAVEFIFGDDNA